MYNNEILNEIFWEAFEDELTKQAGLIPGLQNIDKFTGMLTKLKSTNPTKASNFMNNVLVGLQKMNIDPNLAVVASGGSPMTMVGNLAAQGATTLGANAINNIPNIPGQISTAANTISSFMGAA